jgi:hypothetical protein
MFLQTQHFSTQLRGHHQAGIWNLIFVSMVVWMFPHLFLFSRHIMKCLWILSVRRVVFLAVLKKKAVLSLLILSNSRHPFATCRGVARELFLLRGRTVKGRRMAAVSCIAFCSSFFSPPTSCLVLYNFVELLNWFRSPDYSSVQGNWVTSINRSSPRRI